MRGVTYLIIVVALLFISFAFDQKEVTIPSMECNASNEAFSPGEELTYEISYNWGLIWLDAGSVTFKVELADYKGTPCYKMSGVGGTYPSYDWIYKVRDRFECWVDTATLEPYRYIRDVKEGGRTFYNECFFNHETNKAYCVTIEQNKTPRLDTVFVPDCTFDPMSMINVSRTFQYSKYKYKDTIPISLFLDSKVYPLYIRYLGKDTYQMKDKKTIKCIKFSPLLVEGTIFKGGEGMVVYATDDANKIPVHVEAPILVGTVKANLKSWKGLRSPMETK